MNTSQIFLIYRTKETKSKNKKTIALCILYYKAKKKTSKIIKQNLIFSIGVKIIVLVLSVFGVANMWEAVFADVGATLITVLNSLRILK